MKYLLPISALIAISLTQCKPSQAEQDRQAIEAYIASHDLNAVEKEDGLFVVIDEPGNATQPTLADTVSVFYKGYLTNDKVFDETADEPAVFPLAYVIEGWQQGIPYFGEGGSGKLLIPSALGYGDQKAGEIPANSVIIFDVELVAVNP